MSEERRSRFRNPFRAELPSDERVVTSEADEAVPLSLRITAAYAWRLLLIVASFVVLVFIVIELKLLVVPLLVAILLTALLWPFFGWMLRHHLPRWLAVIVSLVTTIAVIVGLFWLATWQIQAGWDDVQQRIDDVIVDVQNFLLNGPLGLSDAQIQEYLDAAKDFLSEQVSTLATGVWGVATTTAHLATGLLLTFFILICLLFDGAGIWRWTVKLFPRRARAAVNGAAVNGWKTIVNYARTQLAVAAIDAVGIGIGAALLQVPLAVPVAVLVFLGSFVPFVGAVVTGAIAIFLALVYNGIWIALAMLAVVLLVQQIEGHVLQPLMMGAAVKVHPLAVVLVVAGGAMVAGIPGALFAVPLAAFVNVAAVTLSSGSWRTGELKDANLIWSTVPVERRRRNRR